MKDKIQHTDNSNHTESVSLNEKKSAEVLVAAANTENTQRNKQRRTPVPNDSVKKNNSELNVKNNNRNSEKKPVKNVVQPQAQVEQEPLVINIGAMITPENKKTSNRNKRNGNNGNVKRIRDAQEIIDNIK